MSQFRPVNPDNVAHAARLLRRGFQPSSIEPGESVGVVHARDDRQHVSDWTWKVMHMMQLPVRGEVS